MTARRRRYSTVYLLQLRPQPGSNAIRSLRGALKALLRNHKLRCISIHEQRFNQRDRHRRHGHRAEPSAAAKTEEATMGLGRRKTGGESLGKLSWDFELGKAVLEDRVRTANGWETEQHNVENDEFRAICDLPNVERGWIAFIKGQGINAKLVLAGEDPGEQPSDDHREGLRLVVKMDRELGGNVRELISTAQAMWTTIDRLHDNYLAGVGKHPDCLPVVDITGVREEATRKGPILAPEFKISGWVSRPPDLPVTGIPLIVRAKKATSNGASQAIDEQAKAEFLRPKAGDPFKDGDEIPF
jgi:hypothetical protein